MSEAAKSVQADGHYARRRSLLELAPLELDCMTALWLLGEGTVREIRETLAPRRPRAYTTIMTIMDRLTRKGIVERQRTGRAWRYRANLSKEDARTHAVAQVVENFFGGSAEALLRQMAAALPSTVRLRDSAGASVADALETSGSGMHAEKTVS